MANIRSLVENKKQLDYKALTLSLVQEFGIKDKVEWDSVIPAQVQKELFGGETLRLFKDHESFANQKDIRAIHRSKGETSQLLILSAILNDEKLSKQTIERITKKFVGGQAAERYVVWFLGNPQQSIYKVVLSGREGKKVVLKTLPFAVDQPYYKTYDFILNEVSSKVNKLFVEPNELWKALWKSFDISVVNKQFYNDIKISFTDLVENVLAKSFIKEIDVKKHFAIRLIGRIIFSWFLKKKGIISEDFLSSKAVGGYTNYYKELLEKLFFDVFNTPFNDRKKTLPAEIKDLPFLNGGLFEDQKDDFKDNYQLFLPNEWFFNLFNLTLEKYNFTIDENTSSNSEIAIDPEMLGRIFENLLAEQNPETQESARKATGSYYTPREIVDYMVEQSLIEYLKSNFITSDLSAEASTKEEVKQSQASSVIARNEVTKQSFEQTDNVISTEGRNLKLNQAIEDFVHTEEFSEELNPYSKQILDSLNSVKVLDPACGSGAFPIGMLQKLIALKQAVLSFRPKGEISKPKDEKTDIYSLKLDTILNSIYGCDIQPMAVELSRLRCWLSLIIDEPVDKKKPNWSIANLPNLDFKFVCVNALISLPEFTDSFAVNEDDLNNLKQLRTKYFSASAAGKEEIAKAFAQTQGHIIQVVRNAPTSFADAINKLIYWKPFEITETTWFDPFWMFGIETLFDIIIANPPYLREKDNQIKFEIVNNSTFGKKYHQGKMDYWYYFLHKAIDLISPNGFICYITSRYWLNSYGATKLIKRVQDNLNFRNVVDIGNVKVFDSVVGYHMISLYSKNKRQDEFIYKKIVDELDDIAKDKRSDTLEIRTLKNSDIFSNKNIYFDNNHPSNIKTIPLNDICYSSIGIQESPDKISSKMLLKNPSKEIAVGDGVFVLTDEELKNLNLSNDEKSIIKKYLDPSDVNRYFILEKTLKYIIYSDKENKSLIAYNGNFSKIKNHLDHFSKYITSSNRPYGLHRPRDKKYFESPKIVFKGMFKEPDFTIDLNNYFLGFSFTSLVLKDSNFSLQYILAILNSKFAKDWFYRYGKHRGIGVDIGVEKLRQFPIAKSSSPAQQKLINIVTKILEDKANNPKANTKILENQIDLMVYKLYSLNYDEVKIIDPDIENIITKEDYERFEISEKV